MARSKKRPFRRSFMRRTGPKADWVYRPNVFDAAGGLIDALSTYKLSEDTVGAGDSNAIAMVLYDSHNRLKNIIDVPSNAPRVFASSARAEGRKAKILRVQGVVFVRPSTWALGSTLRLAMRFGVFEQDPVAGALSLDTNYRLWDQGTDVNGQPAMWANNRRWQHERRFATTFSDNAQVWSLRYNFRVNRTLDPGECYGIFISSSGTSVTCLLQPWLRTLVSDEG